jgi:DNA polymerase III sliding clamp (beta) subunit (PCNA family)
MEISYQRKELLSILSKVKETVASSKLVPLYQCFCFRDNKVASFNGSAGTMTSCKLDNANFAVDATRFYKIIQAMSDDISLTLKDQNLWIASGRNQTVLRTAATKGFADLLPRDPVIYSEAQNLVAGLKAVSFCVGSNPMRPQFMGVAIEGRYLYSCDGIRISRYRLDEAVPNPITIPAQAVEHICRLGQPTYLFTSGGLLGCLWAETKTIYVTQTLAFGFPTKTVEDMLSNQDDTFAEFPDELSAAVSRVKLLTPADDTELIVESDGKTLKLSATTSEIGNSTEEMDWEFPQKFKFAIKPFYMEQGLKTTNRVDLSDILTGTKRMLRFSENGFDHLCGLMTGD